MWNHQSPIATYVCGLCGWPVLTFFALKRRERTYQLQRVRSHSPSLSTYSLIQLDSTHLLKAWKISVVRLLLPNQKLLSTFSHLLAFVYMFLFFRLHTDEQVSKEYQQQEYQQQQDLYPVQNCYGLGQDPLPR